MGSTATEPAKLHLTPELLENIRGLSFDGLKALPRRGAEIGGLITAGHASADIADDLVLVKCEYLYGPSFHLSPNDLPKLCAAVQQCRAERKIITAFFRSCTRAAVEIEPEDLRAIDQCCADVPFVILVRPSLNGGARMHIFSRGPQDAWLALDEFALPSPAKGSERPEVRIPLPENVEPVEGRAPDPVEYPAAQNRAPLNTGRFPEFFEDHALPDIPEEQESTPGWPLKSFAYFALLCILAGAGYVMTRRPPNPVTPAPAPVHSAPPVSSADAGLGLAVREEGGSLHLTWNRSSEAAKSATAGVLEIDDANSPATIGLAPADITEGSLLYSPHSSDVKFRLRILNASGNYVSEAIRVVDGARTKPAEQPLPAPPPAERIPVREIRQSPPPLPVAHKEPESSPEPVSSQGTEPPIPIHQVNPAWSRVRSHLEGRGKIGILVWVDERGIVTSATAVQDGKHQNLSLVGLCLSAARQWTFQPAKLNGKPVAGQYRIEFTFPQR